MERILQIKGDDFMKGISFQPNLMKGGIFQSAPDFDPFRTYGLLQQSPVSTLVDHTTVTKTIKYFAGYQQSGNQYYYAYADNGSTLAMYRVADITQTITDVTSSIASSSSAARGIAIFNALPWYAKNTEIRYNTALDFSGTDTSMITGLTSGEHPFKIGADLNLYFANGNSVGRIVYNAGSPVATAAAFSLEMGMTIRKLINDGRYLIILADNGVGANSGGRVNSVVAYWDMTSGNLTQRFDYFSGGIIGGEFCNNSIYILDYDGLFICNSATSPTLVASFKGNSSFSSAAPVSSSTILVKGDILYWATSSTIYGYGNPIPSQNKIFFTPHFFPLGGITALTTNGSYFWVGTSTSSFSAPAIYYTNSNTYSTINVVLANVTVEKPYRLKYIKVVTSTPLSVSQNVTVQMTSAGGIYVPTNSTQKSFSDGNVGARQVLWFSVNPTSSTKSYFEDYKFIITLGAGVGVEKIEIWAEPVDNQLQEI